MPSEMSMVSPVGGLLVAQVRAFQHFWIHNVDWLAGRVSDDLVEYV